MSTYQKKLRDPRWRSRRQEILRRDDHQCQGCGESDAQLHVHHIWYKGEPWEAPDKALVTLCDTCHAWEHAEREDVERQLLNAMKTCLVNDQVQALAEAITYAQSTGVDVRFKVGAFAQHLWGLAFDKERP